MDAADEISREYEARTRPGRLSPRLEITGEGMVLGAGTVLAAMEKDARGRPRLALDERRAAAILSTAFEHAVDPPFLGWLRRAAALWNDGELALAQLHLIFAGLPPCDDSDIVLRIFVAEEPIRIFPLTPGRRWRRPITIPISRATPTAAGAAAGPKRAGGLS